MAEIWAAAAATVVVGAYSANQAKKGAKGAANAAAAGSAAEIAERQRQFDLTRADNLPFLEAGQDALTRQQDFLSGDTSGFENSADYRFAVDEGFKGLNYGRSANGGFGAGGYAGGPDADRIALGQGLATQYATNYWNKLAGRAGQGQQAGQWLGGAGMNMANANANSLGNATAARMSSYGDRADANSQFAAGVGNAFGQYFGNRQQAGGNAWGWGGV